MTTTTSAAAINTERTTMTADVVIVGAGWSGIFALKHCIEKGLSAMVVEASSAVGGQWVYNPNKPGGVLPTTVCVASKLYMTPSDFPFADDMVEFPTANEILKHFHRYIDHFGLREHIHLNSRVNSIEKVNGLWAVQAQDTTKSNHRKVFTGSKIVMCTGACLKPKYPTDPMYSNFTGTRSHIAEFKGDKSPFVGKRVLVVGGSDSAVDLAHGIRDLASKTTLSLRRGAWFQGRTLSEVRATTKACPADMYYNRMLSNILGLEKCSSMFQHLVENVWGESGSGIPEWKSEGPYVGSYYVKSRHIVYDVQAKKVHPRRGVRDIQGSLVWFDGQEEPEEYDHIVFGTGYSQSVPFEMPFDQTNHRYNLVLDVDDPSIAWLGFCRPFVNSFIMIIEMQALWMANAFVGDVKIPDQPTRRRSAIKEFNYLVKRFPQWQFTGHMYLIESFEYMDCLAKEMGMKPDLVKLFLKNPIYWWHAVFGSWTHFHYYTLDKNPNKASIAKEEMEKIFYHPTSLAVKNEVSHLLFTRLPYLALRALFGKRSVITQRYRIFAKTMLKVKSSTTLKISNISPKEARVCLLSQVAMADGILSTAKMSLLRALRDELEVQFELENMIAFARITDPAAFVGLLWDKDRALAMADQTNYQEWRVQNGGMDERELSDQEKLFRLLQSPAPCTMVHRIQPHFLVESVENPKALVIFFGWLGAKSKTLAKYHPLYTDSSSIQVTANEIDVLAGNEGNLHKLARSIVTVASEIIQAHPSIPVITHCFSSGGVVLLHKVDEILESHSQVECEPAVQLLAKQIQLQVFDSGPVSARFQNVYNAIKASVSNPIVQLALFAMCWIFTILGQLWCFLNGQTSRADKLWKHVTEAQSWRKSPVTQAYIYSLEDKVCHLDDLRELIACRKASDPSTKVVTKEFKSGRHCNLLREHEKEYASFIHQLQEAHL